MKTSITLSMFRDAFTDYNRAENFSYNGLTVLYNALIEYEESTDTEMELDVIALCCEYSEGHYEDIASYYDIELSGDTDADIMTVSEYLGEQTWVIGRANVSSFVYQSF